MNKSTTKQEQNNYIASSPKHPVCLRAIFIIILLLLILLADWFSYWKPTMGYINKLTVTSGSRFGYDEVVPTLDRVSEDDGTTMLLLGDSVANQLFDGLRDKNDTIAICPINRAITLAGQYVIIKEYLANHPDATDIYMVFYPGTLSSSIEPVLSYQYIAMPFIENGYEKDLEGLAMNKLEDTYGKFFLRPEVLSYIDNSGVNRKLFFSNMEKKTETESMDAVSDISLEYLVMIYNLCQKEGVNIHMMSTPVADIDIRHEEQASIKQLFDEYGLSSMYPEYCDSFSYYPAEMFIDEVHFKPEYKNRETMNPIIEKMIFASDPSGKLSVVFEED